MGVKIDARNKPDNFIKYGENLLINCDYDGRISG